jgi:hypothetical protein
VCQDTFAPVLATELFELVIHVLDNEIGDALDGQVGDEADGEFALDRARNDGLAAGCGYRLALSKSSHVPLSANSALYARSLVLYKQLCAVMK